MTVDALAHRDLLRRLMAGPATGDALARESGQTRAAVWKRVEALRRAGIAVAARPGHGYTLPADFDLLDAATITAQLPEAAHRRVHALEVAWSLVSTNSELLARQTPACGAAILLAERQTGGRGRRGRSWTSPLAANLYLSLARQYGGGLSRLAGVSLVAGVAVAAALRQLGFSDVALKWPNDVVVDDGGTLRKLAGVLVEGGGQYAGPVRAVLGLGLNVRLPATAAAAIDQPWTDLATLAPGQGISRNAVAAAVIDALLERLERFDREGLAPFLGEYRARDVLAGAELTVEVGGTSYTGTGAGIGDDGALQVRVDGRLRSVHAGEVSVRRR